MKCLILVAFIGSIATISANPPNIPGLAKFKAECIEETGVKESILKKIFDHELIEDHAGKCFKKCMCTKIGSCMPDFKINPDVVVKKRPEIPAEKIREFAPICNEISKEDDCETFYARYRCFLEHIPEIKGFAHEHQHTHDHE